MKASHLIFVVSILGVIGAIGFCLLLQKSKEEDRAFKRRFWSCKKGMKKSIVLQRLGKPNHIGETYQQDGKTWNIRDLRPSGSTEFYVWYLGRDLVFHVGFNEKGVMDFSIASAPKGSSDSCGWD
jgi:hypothetical protein